MFTRKTLLQLKQEKATFGIQRKLLLLWIPNVAFSCFDYLVRNRALLFLFVAIVVNHTYVTHVFLARYTFQSFNPQTNKVRQHCLQVEYNYN